MSERFSLRLLGGFSLATADGKAIPVPGRKGAALLAYLGATAHTASPRDTLAALLWGQSEQRLARQSLRQSLGDLGRGLAAAGASILRLDGQDVSLDTGHVHVDAAKFEALIATKSVDALTEAAALYKGEFLAGLSTDAPEFEDWLANSRGYYRDLALRALVDLIEHRRAAGHLDLAAQSARQALRIDPYREDLHRWLMRLHAARGMRGAALAQYRECESILRRELSVSPDDETIRLHEKILARREPPTAIARTKSARSTDTDQTGAADNASPFIGREAELSDLAQQFIRVSEDGARLIVIGGEAGVGKSRLIKEFLRGPIDQTWSVISVRAHATERPLTFGLWADLLNSRALEGADGPSVSQSLARRLAFVRGGPGAWDRRSHGAVVDHPYVFDAMVELIHARAGADVLLLVIEDLQHVDAASLRLLSYVVRNLRQASVFVVAAIRQEPMEPLPDALRDLDRDGRLTHVRVRPLSRSQTVELTRALRRGTGDRVVPRSRLREIWYLSDGNPQIIEEAAGASDGDGGDDELPAALRAELSRHLEGLDEIARRLAALASVIGERCSLALLGRAAELTEIETVRGAEALIAAGLCAARGNDLIFARRRLRHGLYGSLLPARRRRLHESVARGLQAEPGMAPEARHAALVHHFAAAGCDRAARRSQLQLGHVFFSQGAYAAAGKAFSRVLEMGATDAAAKVCEIDARLGRAAVAEIAGQVESALAELRILAANADGPMEPRHRASLLLARGRLNHVLGNHDAAYDCTRHAIAEAGRGEVRRFWPAPDQLLERIHVISRTASESIAATAAARDQARRQRLCRSEAIAASMLALLLAARGQFELAQGQTLAAGRAAKRLDESRVLALVWQVRGIVQTWAGDVAGALDTFKRASEMAECAGDLVRIYLVRGHRGHALALAGRFAEGKSELDLALTMATRLDLRFSRPLFEAWRASALADAGDAAAALSASRAALRSATAANRPWPRSIALRSLARALAHPDVRDLAGAEWAITSALAEQSSLGLEFERPHTLAAYAEILKSAGDTQGSTSPAAQAEGVLRRVRSALNREAVGAPAKPLCTPCAAR